MSESLQGDRRRQIVGVRRTEGFRACDRFGGLRPNVLRRVCGRGSETVYEFHGAASAVCCANPNGLDGVNFKWKMHTFRKIACRPVEPGRGETQTASRRVMRPALSPRIRLNEHYQRRRKSDEMPSDPLRCFVFARVPVGIRLGVAPVRKRAEGRSHGVG